MGANLVPIVRNFSIHHENFSTVDHAVEDGCVTPGPHRVMRFDFLSHNIGDADLVVGSPAAHPEWFVLSASHGHYHLKHFNEFVLLDCCGNEVTQGYKQAFCLIDVEHRSAWGAAEAKFTDCNTNQGISAGWADLYRKTLPCQFIVIDDVPDGDYILVSTTNAQRIIPEDSYSNNTIYTGLQIAGDTVTERACLTHLDRLDLDRWAAVVRILFGVIQDGGGVVIPPGGGPVPVDPWGPLRQMSQAKRSVLLGLAVTELASLVHDAEPRQALQKAGVHLLARSVSEIQREVTVHPEPK
jgi:hypothetical protein